MARRRSSRPSRPRIRLSNVGEELLELASRAGLAPHYQDDLRETMSAWARRFKRRTPAVVSEDAALVALTVSYLRKYRNED
jgi:hypothetical protein